MSNEVKNWSGLKGRRPPLTLVELQALVRKSRPWVYKAMKAGLIRYIMIGDTRAIPPEEADRIEREGIASLRPPDIPPPKPRARFPRKKAAASLDANP
jgi:hypothetical protein